MGDWKVIYKDGRKSIPMPKHISLDYLKIFDDALYIEEVGKRIYKKVKEKK